MILDNTSGQIFWLNLSKNISEMSKKTGDIGFEKAVKCS